MIRQFAHAFAPVLVAATFVAGPSLGYGGMTLGFAAIDSNGDGKITPDEMSAAQAKRTDGMDADGDGFVTDAEMKAFMLAKMTARVDEMVKKRIGAQDSDKDGKLSLAELAANPREEKLFVRMDRNDDGSISKDEFDKAMAWMRARHHRMSQEQP